MKNLINAIPFIVLTAFISYDMNAQDVFKLEITSDSLLAGNVTQITYHMNNTDCNFEAPDFSALQVVSGPNQSSFTTMVNKEISTKTSISYTLLFKETGVFYIPPAYCIEADTTYEVDPIEIQVLPNPEGIIEEPPTQQGWIQYHFPNTQPPIPKFNQKDSEAKKKSRKLKKF